MPATPEAEQVRRLYCDGVGVEPFSAWENRYAGQDCIVCGLGPSLNDLKNPSDYWTFGVNDHTRIGWEPDFLVLMDGVHNMAPIQERGTAARNSRPKVATFQRLPCARHWLPEHHRIVEYDIWNMTVRRRQPKDDSWLTDYPIAHQDTTTFTAAVIAWRLGFQRIGVIGCDLGYGYAWAPGGPHRHPLHSGHKESITEAFGLLRGAAQRLNGADVFSIASETQVDWGAQGSLERIRRRDGAGIQSG